MQEEIMAAAEARQPQMGLNFEQVWAAIQASREESDRRHQEFQEEMRQREEREERRRVEAQKEEDRRRAEEDRRRAEEDRRRAEAQAEAERKSQELRAEIREVSKNVGGLNRSFGDLAEHLVAPGIAEKFNKLGHNFDAISPGGKRIKDKGGNTLAEVDLLLENMVTVAAVEVKSRPKEEDIEEHKERLEVLREYMDKHNDHREILGGIAGAIFPENLKREVIKAGMYAIVQSGDTMKIETPPGFVPRKW
jgi:hypothetical protein